jgi:hypothetical protein
MGLPFEKKNRCDLIHGLHHSLDGSHAKAYENHLLTGHLLTEMSDDASDKKALLQIQVGMHLMAPHLRFNSSFERRCTGCLSKIS